MGGRSLRPSVVTLVHRLEHDELVSLSNYGPARMKARASAEQQLTQAEAEAILRAACRSRRLRVMSFRGTLVDRRLHTHVLTFLAQHLPESHVVCLNVGEFTDASLDAYRALVRALPHSFVGNMYWHDPDPTKGTQLKTMARDALRDNRKKDFYRAQLNDDALWDAVLRFGCKAWWDATTETRDVSKRLWADGAPTPRCKSRCHLKRCKAVNKRDQRCCLCTRDPTGYCHHHKK